VVEHAVERAVDREDEFRAPRSHIRLLQIPDHRFVMIDGSGPPTPEAFESRMPGLYGCAYPLRFALKFRGVVTKVGPLEGLWWSTDPAEGLPPTSGDAWRWTLMIGLPDGATPDEIETCLGRGRQKLVPELATSLRAEAFDEGVVAQQLYVGPYGAEGPTIAQMHEEMEAVGLRPRDRHHELYLGDPRRCAPDRLRTLLRQPVA
jgi:hypothetical protein